MKVALLHVRGLLGRILSHSFRVSTSSRMWVQGKATRKQRKTKEAVPCSTSDVLGSWCWFEGLVGRFMHTARRRRRNPSHAS